MAKPDGAYRYSYVRMFYSYKPGTYTPSPFAELRIFLFSREKKSASDEAKIFETMKFGIEFMEWIFISMMISILKKSVYWEIDGKTTPPAAWVDRDEAERELLTTGVQKPAFDEYYRYVEFKKKKSLPYNEYDVRQIENARMRVPKFTQVSTEALSIHVRKDTAYWERISFKQYLELKKILGVV